MTLWKIFLFYSIPAIVFFGIAYFEKRSLHHEWQKKYDEDIAKLNKTILNKESSILKHKEQYTLAIKAQLKLEKQNKIDKSNLDFKIEQLKEKLQRKDQQLRHAREKSKRLAKKRSSVL
jgi:Skp family chaperone for outer membrane proteins